ncbi:hypothetical protein, partial [Lysinibacillus sp. BPa_S21]
MKNKIVNQIKLFINKVFIMSRFIIIKKMPKNTRYEMWLIRVETGRPQEALLCAKAKRQQQMFSVAKAKRQLQMFYLRESEATAANVFCSESEASAT